MNRTYKLMDLEILTHSGIFHADEVFAVAILETFFQKKAHITRTRDKERISEAQKSPECWVIDIGLEHDTSKLNFDHHQEKEMDASNLLIWKHLPFEPEIKQEMMPFMSGISDYDTNKGGTLQEFGKFNFDNKFRLLSHIVSGFNYEPMHSEQDAQFGKAVMFATEILQNEIRAAQKRIDAQLIWEKRQELAEGKIILFEEFCAIWKEKAKDSSVLCKVFCDGNRWNIFSINTHLFLMPNEQAIKQAMSQPEEFIFVHPSGFIAGFQTKAAALEVAQKLVATLPDKQNQHL